MNRIDKKKKRKGIQRKNLSDPQSETNINFVTEELVSSKTIASYLGKGWDRYS